MVYLQSADAAGNDQLTPENAHFSVQHMFPALSFIASIPISKKTISNSAIIDCILGT